MLLSGLESLSVDRSLIRFLNVGERCNLAGSIAFKKLILAGKFLERFEVAAGCERLLERLEDRVHALEFGHCGLRLGGIAPET